MTLRRATGIAQYALSIVSITLLGSACGSAQPIQDAAYDSTAQSVGTCALSVVENKYNGAEWWGTIKVKNTASASASGLVISFDIPKSAKCDYAATGWTYSQSGTTCTYRMTKGSIRSKASVTFNYSTNSQSFSAAKNVKVSASSCNAGGSGTPNPPPSPAPSDPDDGDSSGEPSGGNTTLTWRKANLTNFTSYPDPGSEECLEYNGCTWAGQFAGLDNKMPESWVKANNIAAVHSKDFGSYKLKTLRLKQGSNAIDVKVYDMCADSDCSGCCTANARETGFLIDIESYTAQRFGSGDGIVEWACIDCK